MHTMKRIIATAAACAAAGVGAGWVTTGVASQAHTFQQVGLQRTVQAAPCLHRADLNCYWDGSRLRYEESFSVTLQDGMVCRLYVDPFRQWALEDSGSACVPQAQYAPPILRRHR